MIDIVDQDHSLRLTLLTDYCTHLQFVLFTLYQLYIVRYRAEKTITRCDKTIELKDGKIGDVQLLRSSMLGDINIVFYNTKKILSELFPFYSFRPIVFLSV